MTYAVQHGPRVNPREQRTKTVAGAVRIAVSFAREGRKDVRVLLPDGRELDFEAFQDAIFRGVLRD